ncbi:LexA family protein [Flavobacterium mesophilum]|uniref:LexA family protein n=1 Tax=Flavobacterium mesophilum TaxID=3143495 RepID=UPI0031D3A9D7
MKERHLITNTLQFYAFCPSDMAEVAYFDDGIPAGFPSPADDFQELTISFDKEVFGTSPSTIFCARVSGSSMEGAGISNNDIIAVDRSLIPENGDIAVCLIYDEFTLKRLRVEKDCVWLLPENDKFQPIKITDNESFQIWGIVINTLKFHRNRR